jgi:hypothetical protein
LALCWATPRHGWPLRVQTMTRLWMLLTWCFQTKVASSLYFLLVYLQWVPMPYWRVKASRTGCLYMCTLCLCILSPHWSLVLPYYLYNISQYWRHIRGAVGGDWISE